MEDALLMSGSHAVGDLDAYTFRQAEATKAMRLNGQISVAAEAG